MTKNKTYRANGREFYSGTTKPVWRQRHRQAFDESGQPAPPLSEDPYVIRQLKHLDNYERETRPGADETARGKDRTAFQALQTASRLVNYIAGWAIDHERGLAETGLRFVPEAPTQTHNNHEYIKSRAEVDTHDHEKLGSTGNLLSAVEARQFVRNVLLPMVSNLRFPGEIIEALEALEFGETLPILQKTKTTTRTGLTVYRAKLSAVAYIEYENAKGTKKYVSKEVVAEEFRVGRETIKDWPAEVRAVLNKLEVSRTIDMARLYGGNYKEEKKLLAHGDEVDLQFFENRYGRPALLKAAKRFHSRSKTD
jgi:hypothetical protein